MDSYHQETSRLRKEVENLQRELQHTKNSRQEVERLLVEKIKEAKQLLAEKTKEAANQAQEAAAESAKVKKLKGELANKTPPKPSF